MNIKTMLPIVVAVIVGLVAYNMVIKKVISPEDSFELED